MWNLETTLMEGLLLFAVLVQVVSSAEWYTASDGHQYLIEEETKYNWLQAMDQCSQMGLQLAVIDNEEKNEALTTLLRSIFGTSRDLWIGHHDAFNTKKDKKRNWYSIANGEILEFSYWHSGEPNNHWGEHCAQIYGKADFRWNDGDCASKTIGFICEENYHTSQCRLDVENKKNSTNERISQIAQEFVSTQNNIQKIISETRNESGNLLIEWKRSTENILENFKNLKIMIANLGKTIDEVYARTNKKILKLSESTRERIESAQEKGEELVYDQHIDFADKLEKFYEDVSQTFA
ncbi:lectin subunit alpha-like [Haematobia irritans]|uniref:lectin subunit alpha-like n=1 Tax=Haematobia irritans TaxID=7368 RepID=UPI003F50C9F4